MSTHCDISKLSPHLFWDTDATTLDPEVHFRYIIPRVMDRGNYSDVKHVWDAYGAERVKEALTQCRCLNKRTISFFANQFGVKPTAFRAFDTSTHKQTWDAA